MNIGLGAVKGAALGILYALIAAPPFARVYFGSWDWVETLLPLVAMCSVPAGAGVGGVVALIGPRRRGVAGRAQLAMLGIYSLTGVVFFSRWEDVRLLEGLRAAVVFSPVFVPLALLATWAAVRWIRRNTLIRAEV